MHDSVVTRTGLCSALLDGPQVVLLPALKRTVYLRLHCIRKTTMFVVQVTLAGQGHAEHC